MKIYKDGTIELTVEEYLKIRANPSDCGIITRNPNGKTMKKEHKESYDHNKKVTLEQIRQIKSLAEQGMDNKTIAERLNLHPSLIPYWRLHTPKDYK